MAIAIAVLLGFLSVAGVLAWTRRAPTPPPAAPAPAPDGYRTPVIELAELLGTLTVRVSDLETKVAGLPDLYKEMADRAERAAERARKSASRSRAQREDADAGAGGEPPPADVRGSEAGGMFAVPTGVEAGRPSEQEAYLAAVRRQLAFM